MALHPWSLLIGAMFGVASLVSWLTPAAVKGSTGAAGLEQFIARFIFPILGGMFVFGAVAAAREVLPDNIWFHALLLIALAVELLGVVLVVWQTRQPRRTRTAG